MSAAHLKQVSLVKDEIAAAVQGVPFWFHSIDVGDGVVTPGLQSSEYLKARLHELQLPDLHGKTVLDIGAYDGFYSFEAERRGASRVVSLDHYVWSLDLREHVHYWAECKQRGIVPEPYHSTPHWRPADLPGKRGYDTAHRLRDSRAEVVVADFMTFEPATLGTFDVVLFLGVLYHLENPLGGMRRVFELTGDVAIIETAAVVIPGYEHVPLSEFYESNELNGDVSNWWAPNLRALIGLCRAAGFRRVEPISKPSARRFRARLTSTPKYFVSESSLDLPGRLRLNTHQNRAIVHAWK